MTLDLIVCGLILFFALLGALAGGLLQLSHLGALFLAGLLAKPLGVRLGPAAAQNWKAPEIVGVLAMTVLIFFVTYAVVQVIARALIKRVTANAVLGSADKMLGFGMGGAKAGLILYVLLSALIFFEKPISSISALHFDTRGSHVADFVRAHDLFTNFSFPGTKGLTAMARVAGNPAAAQQLGSDPEFQALAKDPRVAELMHDGELQRALQSGDTVALLRNNRVMHLLSDPSMQDRLASLGDHLGEVTPAAQGKTRR